MRTALLLVAMTIPAAAYDLPIREGVTYCTDTLEISSEGVFGPDHECMAVVPPTRGGAVLLLCENAEPQYGPPWTDAVAVIENEAANTLLFVDHDGPSELTPCSAQ